MIRSKIFALENIHDPYPEYHRMRTLAPVWWSQEQNRWVITKYQDNKFVLSSEQFSVGRQMANFKQLSSAEQHALGGLGDFLNHDHTAFKADRPKHTRLKKVETACLSGSSFAAIKPFIQNFCMELLDKMEAKGEMDVVNEYAAPIALTTISQYLGFPAEDIDKIRAWVKSGSEMRAMVGKYEAAARYQERGKEIRAYVLDLIANFRQAHRPGAIGDFIEMYEQGRLENIDELFWTIYTMMSAGHHTTLNTIVLGVLSFLRNPGQWELLKAQPSLIPSAVEEVLRYDSYVQFLDRVALEDVEISGQHIAKGSLVGLCIGAANRDPEFFDQPDAMDITRNPNKHLCMGHSIHYCSGAGLGKHELAIAFETLATRLPDVQLKSSKLEWGESFAHRYLKRLPVFWKR